MIETIVKWFKWMFVEDVKCEVKKKRTWTRVSEQELNQIHIMHENGFEADEIAEELDRSISTIYLKLKQMRD